MIQIQRLIMSTLVVALLSAISPQTVYALGLDPALHGLCGDCVGNPPQPNLAAFQGLTRAYGLALAPPVLSPANTIGINAIEMDMSYSFTHLTESANSWVEAIYQRTPPTSLMSTHFTVRKGLPYSFEIEGQLGYMLQSELWTIGGSAKWSFHEAVRAFPIDFMVRGSGNRVIGSTQFDLSTVGLDLALGSQMSVFQFFNLSPYVSYSPIWIFSGSSALDATPGIYEISQNNMSTTTISTAFVFPRQEEMVHRISIGTRLLIGLLKLTPEIIWSSHQLSVNFSLGLHF